MGNYTTRVRRAASERAVPYVAPPPIQQWLCADTVSELHGWAPRAIPVRERPEVDAGVAPPSGWELSWTDGLAGGGGSSQGIHRVAGNGVRMAINHWPLAVETHNHNMPWVDHDVANVARVDPARYPRTDCAWFSPECFPAATTILTRRGLVPIEQVRVGDFVLTHKLRWRRVTATMSKRADTVIVSGYGHGRLETTGEHPFYARRSTPGYATRRGRGRNGKAYHVPRQLHDHAEWVPAADLGKGSYWASPAEFGEADVPIVQGRGVGFDTEFWWFVGRWLGDGCLRADRGEVQVTCGLHEAENLEKRLSGLAPPMSARAGAGELRWRRRDLRTAVVFATGHRGLTGWLRCHFGEHADGKAVPAWALGMRREWREALLEGYVSADGGRYTRPEQRDIVQCHTVSRALAVGIRLLALSLGHKVSLSVSSKRTEGVIEGRHVTMRPLWRVHWCADPSPKHDQTRLENGLRWSPVRQVKPGRTSVEVFNLSVAEDESYIADGVIVHNCTTWSIAQGRKCDFDTDWEQPSLFEDDEEDDTPADREARWRSRMLMTDVIRFARHHRYKAIIVENVPDILKWSAFPRLLAEMAKEGYHHKVITLNSAFAHAWGPAAPQLRDRVYIVFWQKRYRTPNWNKWLRPTCWCPTCQQVVDGIYTPKPGPRRPMRYAAQYTYRCPNRRCSGGEVLPYVRPAASVIDFTRPAQRIGDRKRPLAPKTWHRIEDGLVHTHREGWGWDGGQLAPMLVPTGGTRRRDAAPVTRPMATRTTTENDAVVVPPGTFLTVLRSDRSRTIPPDAPLATVVADGSNRALVVPLEGRDGQRARGVDEPLRAQTTRHQDALVVPLRNNGVARPARSAPLVTVAAGGEHQAVVTPGAGPAAADQGQLLTPAGNGHALYQYDTGNLQPVTQPMPTQTTVEGDALMRLAVKVEDCTLRMLAVPEIQEGMDFPATYVLLGKAKRNHVRMLGNAVTGCSAADLVACVTEAVTGADLPRYEFALAA